MFYRWSDHWFQEILKNLCIYWWNFFLSNYVCLPQVHQEENFSSSVLFQENIDEVPPAYFENCICIQCKFQKFNFNDFSLQHMFSKVIRKHIFCNSWYQTSNYAHDKCDCWYSNFLELLVCIYIIFMQFISGASHIKFNFVIIILKKPLDVLFIL